jgi:hypothetical protein
MPKKMMNLLSNHLILHPNSEEGLDIKSKSQNLSTCHHNRYIFKGCKHHMKRKETKSLEKQRKRPPKRPISLWTKTMKFMI